ncbi:MAG: helix-turn-helix transcriptional regulator [Pseudonocardia sp.]|nr:helix-turn-helix transcriptional regulator [Pseudonocardia sp.]
MLRTERGLTRAQLAHAAGVHYQTIGYIERGEFAPSLAVALRLAELFGLPVEAIFSLTPFAPLTGEQLSGAHPTRRTP